MCRGFTYCQLIRDVRNNRLPCLSCPISSVKFVLFFAGNDASRKIQVNTMLRLAAFVLLLEGIQKCKGSSHP